MTSVLDVYIDRRSNFMRMADYKLHYMLTGLRRANLKYRLLEHWPNDGVAGAAFVHVDLTTLPPEFQVIASKYARSINGKAISIDRRLYSRQALRPCDELSGPVIVKTVLNNRGYPELRYESRASRRSRITHLIKKLTVPSYKINRCPPYLVFESVAEVPRTIWEDDGLIVERFLPGTLKLPVTKNRLDFFLDVEMNSRSTYRSLLCRPDSVERTEVVAEVPAEVRQVQRDLHLDYGAVEYFTDEDKVYIVDVNKTICEAPSWIERFPRVAKHMDEITDRLIEYVRAG